MGFASLYPSYGIGGLAGGPFCCDMQAHVSDPALW
jgi:hypothetical protein